MLVETIFNCFPSCNFLPVVLFIIGGILLAVYFQKLWKTNNGLYTDTEKSPMKTVNDIPGIKAFPIIGTKWVYTLGYYKMSKIHEAYEDMFKKYGNILREYVGNVPIVSIVDRSDIELVLKEQCKYPIRPPIEAICKYRKSRPDRYTNLGIVNEQGNTWHKLRSALTPQVMSSKTIANFFPELCHIADDFNALLRTVRSPSNEVRDFEELCNRMSFESTCTLMLGQRMGYLDERIDENVLKLADATRDLFCGLRDTFYDLPLWKLYETKAYKKLVQSEDIIYSVISDIVDNALIDKKMTCDTGGVKSVFMSILQAPDIPLCDRKAAIIDFITAGIQTFGNVIIFLLYLVAKHPHVQQKIYDELIELISNNGELTYTTLNKASYLKACILEAYRVLPTTNTLARILDRDMKLSDYYLKAGTVILAHIGIACKNETNFKNAHEFRPERWINDDEKLETQAAATYLVLPFGTGRRICPGKRFVEQQLHLLLAKIILEFEVSFTNDLELQFAFLIMPKGPVNINLKDRH